jgi:alpha-amylase/alpha-mannosidase (GH57 family)
VAEPVRSVVIHGHFYQPPRDDPWQGTIATEPSAAPFHDWNERIEHECYSRVIRSLRSMSFDFGPTLLAWMEDTAPATYAAVLAADRAGSFERGGHGGAIAMPYHHAILPLSPRRDKTTEVRWGVADFRRRFGRQPEGMWLPETAVDDETLDVLAAEGIRFTILAPHQVERVPVGGLAGWYRTTGGRRIALFLYDGALSHGVAFGSLLRDPAAWLERLTARPPASIGTTPATDLLAMAMDGETFGHHHRNGDVVLAGVLDALAQRGNVRADNFASVLSRYPPREEVRLVAPSSWSCSHGVDRWRTDCGCRAAPERPTHQRWRAPLREALDWLSAGLHGVFEREGGALLTDPWAARDAYGAVLGTVGTPLEGFLSEWLRRPDDPAARTRAFELLELERHALRMFTSCGWFFDDIAGIESEIVLRSAARAIELAGADAPRLESGLLERLASAPSNDPDVASGRDVYLQRGKGRIPRPAPA